MRSTLLSIAAVFLLPAASRADDAADARAIVEKAVKAAGYKVDDMSAATTWKDRGKFTGGGFSMDYTGTWAFQGPDKYRFVIDGEFGGMKISLTVVVNGDKAWESAMGMTREITAEKLEYVRSEVYQLHVTSLLPLLREKEFQLKTAGEKEIDKKKAVGVTVSRDKRTPITLYFDKSTGLLAKIETKVKDEFQEWKEVSEEAYFDEYKEAGGKKFFTRMKVVRDGKTMIESVMSDQKNMDKLDAKLFEKP